MAYSKSMFRVDTQVPPALLRQMTAARESRDIVPTQSEWVRRAIEEKVERELDERKRNAIAADTDQDARDLKKREREVEKKRPVAKPAKRKTS